VISTLWIHKGRGQRRWKGEKKIMLAGLQTQWPLEIVQRDVPEPGAVHASGSDKGGLFQGIQYVPGHEVAGIIDMTVKGRCGSHNARGNIHIQRPQGQRCTT